MITIDWHPSERKLRQFAGGVVVVALALAVARLTRPETGRGALPFSLLALAGFIGLARPRLVKYPFILVSVATWPIGMVMSYLVLGVVFFGVLTPVGLVRRTLGADPLRLRRLPKPETYWVKKADRTDLQYYLRQ